MTDLSGAPASVVLREHARIWSDKLLAAEIEQGWKQRQNLRLSALGLHFDFGRQRLDATVLNDLVALARDCDIENARSELFQGKALNLSEGRPAWHSAVRAAHPPESVADLVLEQRTRQQKLVQAVWQGEYTAADGQAFTDVINIGIGGSDLGPRLLARALGSEDSPVKAHFLGNLDARALAQKLAGLDPQRCLVVVVSKSFRTQETRLCAERVREWLEQGQGDWQRQALAVTANPDRAQEFSIDSKHIFPMWSWVGGRFSVWSAVGLALALSLGWSAFSQLLAGAEAMDQHFAQAPLAENLPVIWGLIGVWNRNFLDYNSQVTAVYSDLLEYLPQWLQQLDMESNGKSVGRDGQTLAHATEAVQWGGVGTHVQHAFFQQLHQGAQVQPVDFILPLHVPDAEPAMQRALLTNALAQSAALSQGRRPEDEEEVWSGADAAWRRCPGERPSSLIWLDRLDAFHMGALLAAYEHRCFVKGWIWGLNSFDQFGVELGKTLAQAIDRGLAGDDSAWPDPLLAEQAQRLRELDESC